MAREVLDPVPVLRGRRGNYLSKGQIQPVDKGSANAEPLGLEPETAPEIDPFDEWFDNRVILGDALEILTESQKMS